MLKSLDTTEVIQKYFEMFVPNTLGHQKWMIQFICIVSIDLLNNIYYYNYNYSLLFICRGHVLNSSAEYNKIGSNSKNKLSHHT